MVNEDRTALARDLHAAAYLTGRFVLRSGQVSDRYFDKYRFEADPALLDRVATGLAGLIPDGIDVVAGLELGGVPLATAVSRLSGLPARFVRKQPKEYGTRQMAEGGPVDGLRLCVLEDVVTSGGQVVASCRALRDAGARLEHVACVVDRQAGGAHALAAEGLELRALFTLAELEQAASAGG